MAIINTEIKISKKNMTARISIKNLSKGFTLIELLVVLGILGILATALVATIDPFEQLKKANDSNVKNAAVELVNASLRYYTTHNDMPWGTGGVANCGTAGAISGAVINTGAGLNCVNGLITDGELKDEFTAATNITQEISITGDTTSATNRATACYRPQSKSQQRDAGTKYTDAAATLDSGGTCKANGGTTDCYWCATL